MPLFVTESGEKRPTPVQCNFTCAHEWKDCRQPSLLAKVRSHDSCILACVLPKMCDEGDEDEGVDKVDDGDQ